MMRRSSETLKTIKTNFYASKKRKLLRVHLWCFSALRDFFIFSKFFVFLTQLELRCAVWAFSMAPTYAVPKLVMLHQVRDKFHSIWKVGRGWTSKPRINAWQHLKLYWLAFEASHHTSKTNNRFWWKWCNGKLWYSNINRFCNFDMFRNFVKNSNPMCDVALSMWLLFRCFYEIGRYFDNKEQEWAKTRARRHDRSQRRQERPKIDSFWGANTGNIDFQHYATLCSRNR